MEGGRTVNLGKLQALRVLNFIRFECVIVKVKSGEMTALSKSNGDQGCGGPEENKRSLGRNGTKSELVERRERLSHPPWLCSEEDASLPLSELQNSMLC